MSDSPTLHSRWLLFFKVMIISLWNLLQYHSIVRWAIQAQWAEPLVSLCLEILTWFLVYECIMMNYRSSLQFVPVQWFLAELWPLGFEIWPNILLSPLYFTMIWDIDLIFGMRVYNHKLQIKFEIPSGWMIFGQLTAIGLWNLVKCIGLLIHMQVL